MSETTTSANDAVPLIRNASPLRVKLIAMQPGETLDITKAELPRSYKGIQSLLTNIRKNYGQFYGALKLTNGSGWRVKRVNTAEEAESFIPKRKRTNAGRREEPVRLYNMTDASLTQMIDEKIIFARRDAADLIPRGVTVAKVDALELDNEAFKNMEVDGQLQGAEQEAVEIKTAARNTLESRIGNLRTMAENTFGTGSVEYSVFGFEGMVGETDENLLRLAKVARKQGVADQAAMDAWGCSVAFLAQLQTDIQTFDTEVGNVKTAEANRKKATVLRIKTGNDLYTRVDKFCNTGKDVYRETDAAKHSDYFLYS